MDDGPFILSSVKPFTVWSLSHVLRPGGHWGSGQNALWGLKVQEKMTRISEEELLLLGLSNTSPQVDLHSLL